MSKELTAEEIIEKIISDVRGCVGSYNTTIDSKRAIHLGDGRYLDAEKLKANIEAQLAKAPVCPEIEETIAQEFYGIFLNDPSNNHLENKEWVLLVEARTRAKNIITTCQGTGKAKGDKK